MFGSRGERPDCRPRSSRWIKRVLASSALSLVWGSALADVYATRDALDINPLDGVMTGSVGAFQEGETPGGLRYRIVRNEGDPSYSSRYNGRIRIEFDRPVAAIGAQVLASGFAPAFADQGSGDGERIRVTETGYYGVVSDNGGIREITLESDSGPIDLGRVDVRPLPLAKDDSVTVYENSQANYDGHLIVNNDAFIQGVKLESPPLHADFFELHEDGSFVYKPHADYHGEDSFLYRATNGNGATASAPATVTLYVVPVNSAPKFVAGGDLTTKEDSGLQTVSGWASDLSAGPAEEQEQTLGWQLEVQNAAIFSTPPSLDLNGNLTFQPANNAAGVAIVTARLHDDGGIENGGQDTSAPVTFTITVLPERDAPILQSIPDCAVLEGDVLRVTARASEVDMDTCVTYSLLRGPEGATINPLSGQILWTPQPADAGELKTFVVQAAVSTDESLNCTTTFQVEVLKSPAAPNLQPIASRVAKPSQPVHFQVAKSADLRYVLVRGAEGAMLNPRTGMFFWKTPKVQAPGTYHFSVAAYHPWDRKRSSVQTFAIRVNAQPEWIAKSKTKTVGTSGQAAMMFAKSALLKAK